MNSKRGFSLVGIVMVLVIVAVAVVAYFSLSKSSGKGNALDGMKLFPLQSVSNSGSFMYLYMNKKTFKIMEKGYTPSTYVSTYGLKSEDITNAYTLIGMGGSSLFDFSFILEGTFNAKDVEKEIASGSAKTVDYRNRKIYFSKSKQPLKEEIPLLDLNIEAFFVRFDDRIIFTMGEDNMKKIIDQLTDGGKSIKDYEGVSELLTKLSSNDIFGIFSGAGADSGYTLAGVNGRMLNDDVIDITIVYLCKDANSAVKVLEKERLRIQGEKEYLDVSFKVDGKFVIGKFKSKEFAFK